MILIALDVDETLLRSDHTISNFTLKTLKKCQKKDIKIALNTVRGYDSAMKIAKQINADYINAERGNLILDRNDNIIYKRPFNKKLQAKIINFFLKHTDKVYVGTIKKFFGKVYDKNFAQKWNIIDYDIKELINEDLYKMTVYVDDEYLKNVFNKFCDDNHLTYYYMRTAPYLIISPENSDKWFGLKKLIDKLNINHDELYVFGDDTTDLMSLKQAKHGIAMSNSKPELLKEIQTICPSNDDDGVARYIEENILN